MLTACRVLPSLYMSSTDAPPDDPDLHAALRAGTDALHRRLDGHAWQRAVLQPGLTLDVYAAYLASHAVAYERCEPDIAALEDWRPDGLPPYEPRIPALRADLASIEAIIGHRVEPPAGGDDLVMNGVSTGRANGPAGGADDDDDARRLGRYLGVRYVLDGATQGGFVIAARLTSFLPTLADGPFAFWDRLAAEASTWDRLKQVLATRAPDDDVAEAALPAAQETFTVFLKAFDVHDGDEPSVADAT